ncbi:MAG: hypothetical protein ACD_5C00027G0003 [uncultured bacterium]|nr:MAG: hypothetical protein ACD_5C00027G0003 [uncultured bacterium]
MYNKLSKKIIFIFLPLSALFLVQVHTLLEIKTWGMALFNNALSVIILGAVLILCLRKELEYLNAKSRLERAVRMLEDFRLVLLILNNYYVANEAIAELRLLLERCEGAKEIVDMNSMAKEAEKMWSDVFTKVMFCDIMFVPRFEDVPLETMIMHINTLRR